MIGEHVCVGYHVWPTGGNPVCPALQESWPEISSSLYSCVYDTTAFVRLLSGGFRRDGWLGLRLRPAGAVNQLVPPRSLPAFNVPDNPCYTRYNFLCYSWQTVKSPTQTSGQHDGITRIASFHAGQAWPCPHSLVTAFSSSFSTSLAGFRNPILSPPFMI